MKTPITICLFGQASCHFRWSLANQSLILDYCMELSCRPTSKLGEFNLGELAGEEKMVGASGARGRWHSERRLFAFPRACYNHHIIPRRRSRSNWGFASNRDREYDDTARESKTRSSIPLEDDVNDETVCAITSLKDRNKIDYKHYSRRSPAEACERVDLEMLRRRPKWSTRGHGSEINVSQDAASAVLAYNLHVSPKQMATEAMDT
jgi:hypothetical protein